MKATQPRTRGPVSTLPTHFSGTFDGSGYPGVTFNDLGQVATLLVLAGPGVTSANDGALYLFDPILGPIKIAREGDQFDIGGGVMRTIADGGIVFSAGHNDDFMNGLSEHRQARLRPEVHQRHQRHLHDHGSRAGHDFVSGIRQPRWLGPVAKATV